MSKCCFHCRSDYTVAILLRKIAPRGRTPAMTACTLTKTHAHHNPLFYKIQNNVINFATFFLFSGLKNIQRMYGGGKNEKSYSDFFLRQMIIMHRLLPLHLNQLLIMPQKTISISFIS